MPSLPLVVSYLVVVLVWSTTPLFVFFSTLAFPPALAGGVRMALAAVLATVVAWATGRVLRRDRQALLTYAAMTPGIFGAMYLTYLAAPRVPSGLISVLFGLSPVVSAACARLLAREPLPSPGRMVAALVALGGLVLVTREGERGVGQADAAGIGLLLVAVLLFSVSGVLVRMLGAGMDALAQTAGGLWLSLPFYALAWVVDGLPVPDRDSAAFMRSAAAIAYLALFGSVLGFVCYYQVLSRMPAASASLITVITPVFALGLGAWVNDERLTGTMLAGAAVVVVGVAGFLVPATVLQGARRRLRFTGRVAAD